MTYFSRTPVLAPALVLAVLAAACGGGEAGPAGPGGPGGGMPPMGVEAVTLAQHPIEQTTEYVGTVKSRRSTRIQPQVEGFLTRIAVSSGDRVRQGALLMEIDREQPRAALASLQATRATREADLAFARQQADRTRRLYDAGAISEQELERAQTALQTAEAQMKTLEAQINEAEVGLQYYRVTAPTAGVVGDVPVRVGDRVTRSTLLTTIDDNRALEIYVNVPVQEAPRLATGLPVRLLDQSGEPILETKVTFVSPSVQEGTQSVLVKAPLPDDTSLRTDQYVRARVVWSTEDGLTVPVTAVSRVNGLYFAFVAERGENGLVARQKPIQVGPVVGNAYVVRSGLNPGDQVIVSGVQKIGDGAPVQLMPAGGGQAPGPATPGQGQ
ncbi:MAG: efflux RND transporter periplasmic adaptor subunit [Vicinamibacterales bacterium]